jgi:hypothetical protein
MKGEELKNGHGPVDQPDNVWRLYRGSMENRNCLLYSKQLESGEWVAGYEVVPRGGNAGSEIRQIPGQYDSEERAINAADAHIKEIRRRIRG